MARAPLVDLRAGLVRHRARIDLLLPTGARTYATFALGGTPVVAELQAHDVSQTSEQLELAIDMNRAVLIDPKTDRVIA
jgi:multiple sugar transport system ATP-binding protein